MSITNENIYELKDLDVLPSRIYSNEENKKYLKMVSEGQKLPDNVFKINQYPNEFFELEGMTDIENIKLQLQIKQTKFIRTIRNVLIFFVSISIISKILFVIFQY